MSCPIATALLHNVQFRKKKHTHTHNFPNILVQAMSCSIDTALWHNVSFTKKKKIVKCTYTHTPLSFP